MLGFSVSSVSRMFSALNVDSLENVFIFFALSMASTLGPMPAMIVKLSCFAFIRASRVSILLDLSVSDDSCSVICSFAVLS